MWDIDIPIHSLLDQRTILHNISSTEHSVTRLSHDSRNVNNVRWFICLPGKSFNGHDFIEIVMQEGIHFFIYDPRETQLRPPGIQTNDTMQILCRIALLWRMKLKSHILAVTGSNGKSTMKELVGFCINHIIQAKEDDVVKNKASLNNHYGVPFTLLTLTPKTKFAVLEIGTNTPGEIQHLSSIGKPDFAIITAIHHSHLESFHTLRNIAMEKYSIIQGLEAGDTLFLAEYLPYKNIVQQKAQMNKIRLCWSSSINKVIKYHGSHLNGVHFSYQGKRYLLPLIGTHQFNNLKLLLIFIKYYIEQYNHDTHVIHDTLRILSNFKNIQGRLQNIHHPIYNIWDDSYNANLDSYRATILSLKTHISSNRFFGAMGFMAELGDWTIKAHQLLAQIASKHMNTVAFFSNDETINQVFYNTWCLKRSKQDIFTGQLDENSIHKGAIFLHNKIQKNDHILVKGSRASKLERIITYF